MRTRRASGLSGRSIWPRVEVSHAWRSAIITRSSPETMQRRWRMPNRHRLAPSNADLLTAPTLAAELALGQWDSAHAHLQRAFILDPRSAFTARQLGFVSLWLRRYPEAWTSPERARALAPDNIGILQNAAMVRLAQGDLVQGPESDGCTPAVWLLPLSHPGWRPARAMYWVLDKAHGRFLLALQPGSWDNDRGAWGTVLAQTYWLAGDRLKAGCRSMPRPPACALQQQINAAPQRRPASRFPGTHARLPRTQG